MFNQPDEEKDSQSNNSKYNQPRRRRKKKVAKNKQLKKEHSKKKSKFALTMSSWAESFTVAATWQLKHQLALWKSRAKALEYENKVLHDIIRKYHGGNAPRSQSESCNSESECEDLHDNSVPDEEDNLEVSEEFLMFLEANARYKEEARIEKEKLKAKYVTKESLIEQMEAGPSQVKQDPSVKLKELYGQDWQRIAALEMSVQTNFMNESDKHKPSYWPNIPFNFNFS